MGKTPKPLSILVMTDELFNHPNVRDLGMAGHEVRMYPDLVTLDDPDVVIGPTCWRIDPALGDVGKQLTLMLKGVRNIKYLKTRKDT